MPQSLKLPDGYKVLDSGKDRSKGLYRMIQRPNGTIYKEWYHLYSPKELEDLKAKDNKAFGQISSHNLEGNAKAATGLAAVNGAVAAGAYYNMTAGRQAKLKRLVRGATLGKTKPQGVGLKTTTASAGDVRGRVVPDRPPAIVRSAGSFNQRGPTMPQQGNLFDQPEPPSGKSKPGRRYAPAGTAKATGKGRRGVPRPAPRVSSKSSGPAPKTPVTQARPTPLNPDYKGIKDWKPTPVNPDYKVQGPKPYVDQRYYATDPLKSVSQPYSSTGAGPSRGPLAADYWTNPNRLIGRPGVGNPNYRYGSRIGSDYHHTSQHLMGEKSMLRPSPLNPDVPDAPSGGTQKSGTRYAPAGTAKSTGKGTRGVPRPAPRSNFKPATGGTPVPEPSTRPTARTTPVQRGGAAPRTPSPTGLPARNVSPTTGKYNGRSTGVSTKPKTPAELKAIEDAMRARRAGTGGRGLEGQRTALRPTPLAPSRVPNSPSGPLTGDRTALRPTPINPNRPTPLNPKYTPTQARPTPLNPEPLVPNSPFKPAPVKPSLLGRVKGFVKASIPAAIATHMLEDAGAGVMSAARGDWKGAGQRGLDLLSHTKFGGLIPAADQAMKGITGKGFRDNATSLGDKIIHAKYIEGKQPASAPRAATPAQSGGGQSGGTSQKPSGPAYFPEASRNGSAVRTPDSYLGEAFDYSLQKGTTSGSKYLEHMFRRDKISADDQQRLRERFNKKVVGDQTLKDEGASRGITENVEGKTPGLGKALLNQYRANNPGNPLRNYQGNTDYGKMRSAAEAALAASKK